MSNHKEALLVTAWKPYTDTLRTQSRALTTQYREHFILFKSTSQPFGKTEKNLNIYVNINFENHTIFLFRIRTSCWRQKKETQTWFLANFKCIEAINKIWVLNWVPLPSQWDSQALLQTPQSFLAQLLLLWGAPGRKRNQCSISAVKQSWWVARAGSHSYTRNS